MRPDWCLGAKGKPLPLPPHKTREPHSAWQMKAAQIHTHSTELEVWGFRKRLTQGSLKVHVHPWYIHSDQAEEWPKAQESSREPYSLGSFLASVVPISWEQRIVNHIHHNASSPLG